MKKLALTLALAVGTIAQAGDIPSGITGLWRFQNSTDKLKATIGTDLTSSHPDNAIFWLGPWTMIGVPGNAGYYADGGVVEDRSYDYLTASHGISGPNGGGSYINEYTIMMDYQGNSGWNSLYQTAWNGNANDGDLWIDASVQNAAKIGVGPVGYSSSTFDATKWHRFVWSVDNGNFFRVYVDGVLFLDGIAQGIDGRFSLELDRFHFSADDNWEDAWGRIGTAAVWNRALTGAEVGQMGGWIGGASTPTELMLVPEPSSLSLLALGALAFVRRMRR